MPAIVARGLTRRYGALTAVDRLDLEVPRGSVVALLGHNGAGKTTAVRLLNGVLAPHGGEATVLGLDPWRDGDTLRRRTGVATERPANDARLSARANLQLYAALYGVPVHRTDVTIEAALARFGLLGRADTKVGTFSRGMTQRLALARCSLHDPELYFLDEPTAGLDPLASRDLRNWIRELVRDRERTVLLCTHDLTEAQRLADRVIVLRDGRIAAEGTPTELATRYGAARLRVEVPAGAHGAAMSALETAGLKATSDPSGASDGTARLSLAGAPDDLAPRVARALVAVGIDLLRLEPRDGSLEDVYAAVYEEHAA